MRKVFASLLLVAAMDCGAAAPLVLAHVHVVDVERGTVARDRFVLVTDGRIAAVGDESVVPPGATRFEGADGYLVPGLIDMHVHLFNNASHRAPNDWALPLFVANGVTGVREMAARVEDMQQVRQWNAAVDDGTLVAPRVLAVGVPVRCGKPQSIAGQVGDIAKAGAFAKVFSDVDAGCWQEIAAAARKHDIVVAGHVPATVDWVAAARDGLRTGEHLMRAFEACSARGAAPEPEMLDAFDAGRCKRAARDVVQAGQAQVPTLVLERVDVHPATPADDPRWPLLRADEQARWTKYLAPEYRVAPALAAQRDRTALAITSVLHDAGATLLAGTDAPMPNVWPGGSLHDELALLVEAGLSPAEALRAATIAPARYLGIEREAGTIEQGKRADLVLLDANPLADIAATRRIRAVVLAGRMLDREVLDDLQRARTGDE